MITLVNLQETARKENLIPRINNITAPIFEKALKSNPSGYLVGNKVFFVKFLVHSNQVLERILVSFELY